MTVHVKCHAKLNLFLRIYGKRPDGYHDIISVMQSIDLADTLLMEAVDGDGIEIVCSNPDVPTGSDNLIWRAAELLAGEAGRSPGGLRISINKKIPVMGGLAGGSADCAAALVGLRQLWSLDLSDKDLPRLAAQLGSDVPFCTVGGTAMVQGRGESVELLPIGLGAMAPDSCAFLLVIPPVSIDTAAAYNALDESREKEARKWDDLRSEFVQLREVWQKALTDGSFPAFFFNDFEETVLKSHPELAAIHTHFRNHAGYAVLSGSGSSMFAYFRNEAEATESCANYIPVAGETAIVALPVSEGVVIGL